MLTTDVTIFTDDGKVAVVGKDNSLPAAPSVVLVGGAEGADARIININSDGEVLVTNKVKDVSGNIIDSTDDGGTRGFNVHITGGNAIVQLPQDSSEMVFVGGFYTTTGSAEQVAATHTVTTGKTFFLVTYSISRAENHNRKALLQIKVDGSPRDAIFIDPAGQTLTLPPIITFPYASAGEVITLTIDEDGGGGGNDWFVKLIGFERDA